MPKKKHNLKSVRDLLRNQGIGFDGDKFVNKVCDPSRQYLPKKSKKKAFDFF